MSNSGGGNGLGFAILAIIGAVSLVVFSITALTGLIVVGGMSASMTGDSAPSNVTSSPNPITGTAVSFADTWGGAEILDIYTVRDTTNTSVNLTGAPDSTVTADGTIPIATDDTWTRCTWARVDPDAAARTMTALSVNGRLIIQYNGSASEWSAWYYDDGSRNSFRVNVSAPNQPGNFTHICAWHNATNLGIVRNTTTGESVNVSAVESGGNIADVWPNAENWDGRLDESRGFDSTLNSSQYAALHNYPVLPLTNATRLWRITYDESSGSKTKIYFTSTRATVSNATWDDGLRGSRLDAGSDYTINEGEGSVTALADGRIDGAPVVWIDYRYRPLNRVGKVSRAIAPAFELLASVSLVIPAIVVLGLLIGGVLYGLSVAARTNTSDVSPFHRRRGGGR